MFVAPRNVILTRDVASLDAKYYIKLIKHGLYYFFLTQHVTVGRFKLTQNVTASSTDVFDAGSDFGPLENKFSPRQGLILRRQTQNCRDRKYF